MSNGFAKLYSIANYEEHYMPKNTKGEDLKYPRYVKNPVKPRGKGIKALLKKPQGIKVFGVWELLLQAATESTTPEHRGKLLNHKDEPASIEEIAESISLESDQSLVKLSLNTLCEMGWVSVRSESVQGTEEVRSECGGGTERVPGDEGTKSDNVPPKWSGVECSEVKRSGGAFAEEFEKEFWPNVPNKIGKGKARESYVKARKKASKEAIHAGLSKYQQYEKRRARQADYRPLHPSTWLNQERWEDDVGVPPNKTLKQMDEAYKQKTREDYGPWLRDKTLVALRDLYSQVDKHGYAGNVPGWLIEEIMKEKRDEKGNTA